MSSAALWFLICSTPFVLVTFAWMFGRKASYHRGAADAYKAVSDDFRGLADATWFKDKAQQKAERRKRMLSLCLCDPNVCDALSEALVAAREYWGHDRASRVASAQQNSPAGVVERSE